MDWQQITPASVLTLESPVEGYLCPLVANTYGIEFLRFEIKDYDTGRSIYQVRLVHISDLIEAHVAKA
jgi:hypothetical protein